MADLKPCPFCGGEASIVMYQGSKIIFYIECKGCKALMGNPRVMISAMEGKLYFENEAELIEAWNTRKPMEAVVAELEKLPQYRWGVTMHTAEDYVKVSDLRKVIEIARKEGEEHDDKLQESQ